MRPIGPIIVKMKWEQYFPSDIHNEYRICPINPGLTQNFFMTFEINCMLAYRTNYVTDGKVFS